MIKKGNDEIPAVLESFSWRKPGVAEAVVVQRVESETAPEPSMPHLPLAMQRVAYETRNREGVIERRWTFRATDNTVQSPTDANDKPSEVWSVDVGLSEDPLTSHPRAQAIMDKYGGVLRGGVIEFPPYLGDGSPNPFYRVESYFNPTVLLTQELSAKGGVVSVSQARDLGWIDDPPSHGFSFLGSMQGEWLLTEQSARLQGNDRTERWVWRWGGRGGWLQQVYKKGYWGSNQ